MIDIEHELGIVRSLLRTARTTLDAIPIPAGHDLLGRDIKRAHDHVQCALLDVETVLVIRPTASAT